MGPTSEAEMLFRLNTLLLRTRTDNEALATALINISEGLARLSTGVRATYNELEEIKRTLRQPNMSSRLT